MPYQIHNESNGLGVVIAFSGPVKAEDIFALNQQLMANELFSRWRYQIWDFSNVERSDISIDDLRMFAVQDADAARINPNQKIAVIRRKSSTSRLYAIFQVLEEVWSSYACEVFHDIDAARKWAGNPQK
jgi:hypothetical protein